MGDGKKIKVLYCLAYASQVNGVTSFIRNSLDALRDRIDAAVVCGNNDLSDDFLLFCRNKKISLHLLPNPYDNGQLTYIRSILHFIRTHHDFDVIHCNIPNYGLFYLREAKSNGIPVRIMHSHSQMVYHRFPLSLIEKTMEHAAVKAANHLFACSEEAGRYLFGNKRFEVIPNSVNYKKYFFDPYKREKFRHQHKIDFNDFCLLYAGRFAKEKNPLFAIKILAELLKHSKKPVKLLMVGQGPLNNQIRSLVLSLKLNNNVIFLPAQDDMSFVYCSADALIMPSFHEGLGLVAVEGQCSNLPCFVSQGVPDRANINERCFIKLKNLDDLSLWADSIMKFIPPKRGDSCKLVPSFDASVQAQRLMDYYIDFCREDHR